MTSQQEPPLSYEEMFYGMIDEMTKMELLNVKKDIEEEIALKEFKEKRVRQIKLEIIEEEKYLMAQSKAKLVKANKKPIVSESDSDEIIETKRKRSPKKK
jgi:hypothetical protein